MRYFLVVLTIVLTIALFVYKNEIVTLLNGEDPAYSSNNPEVILKKINELNTVSAEYNRPFSTTVYKIKGNGLLGIDTPDRYDVKINVTGIKIKAGIDMKAVNYEKIEKKRLRISLPKSKITSVEYNPMTHEVLVKYPVGINKFGEPSSDEVARAKEIARRELISTAKNFGILNTATLNAEYAIREIVTGFGGYTIEFTKIE